MKSLKNTTAVMMALTLIAPHVARAMAHIELDACDAETEAPCVLNENFVLVPVNGAGMITIAGLGATGVMAKDLEDCPDVLDEDATPCLTAEGEAAFALEGEIIAGMSDDVGDDAAEPVESEAADGGDAVDGAEAADAEDVAGDATDGDEPVESEAVDGGEAVDGAEPADPGEADVTAETDTAVESEPVDGGEAVADADAGVETDTAISADTETAAEAGEGSTIEEDTGAKVVEAPEAEADAEGEATVADGDTASQSDTGATAEAVEDEVIVVEEAPAAAAAAASTDATDTESTSAEAEVEVEEVTEETARSADEDFETSVSGEERSAAASSDGGDGDGLSKFEKALLLGLGAAVVGQSLRNGEQVVSNSGDRVVVQRDDGSLRVLKDDDALLRQPGSEVRTETFSDGSTRTVVTREDGTRIVTIRAADGRVVRRARVFEDGSQIVLFDDTEAAEPVNVSELPDQEEETIDLAQTDEEALRAALARAEAREMDRRFSLSQIRQIREVRALAPQIELDAITFATGSAAIQPSQAEELRALGNAMAAIIEERPGEVFLIEGHTDTVGSASYNLALSDRRAETVALALAQYFDVPPENMITQGYGESQLKIDAEGDIRENRRAVIRRITPLLRVAAN